MLSSYNFSHNNGRCVAVLLNLSSTCCGRGIGASGGGGGGGVQMLVVMVVVVYNTQLSHPTLPYATHSTVSPRGLASEGHLRDNSGRREICVGGEISL